MLTSHKLNKHKNTKKADLTINTAFNSKLSIEKLTHRHRFNTLSVNFVVDNSANVHIVNDKPLFEYIRQQ